MTRIRRAATPERDQSASPFTIILEEFCRAAGARAAALVDGEGETVDYAGRLSGYDVRVAAAEWQLVFRGLAANELFVRADRASYFASRVSPEYSLVVCLPRRCFSISRRSVAECIRKLAREAGFEAPEGETACWMPVAVKTRRGRPVAVAFEGDWCAVEVLGRVTGGPGVAYRTRLANGAELTLLKEGARHWYYEQNWPEVRS